MISFTRIGWAHGAQDFWIGCDKCAQECAHCCIARTPRQRHREWGTGNRSKNWALAPSRSGRRQRRRLGPGSARPLSPRHAAPDGEAFTQN